MPHSKRKLVYKSAFLPVSAAFHHSALDPVVEMATADCERMGMSRRLVFGAQKTKGNRKAKFNRTTVVEKARGTAERHADL